MCAAATRPGNPPTYSSRLAEAMRLRDDYKAAALACLLDVNESTISRWKKGAPMTVSNAIALCDALDISMDWLLRGIGPITPPREESGSGCAEPAAPPRISDQTFGEIYALLAFAKSGRARPSCA